MKTIADPVAAEQQFFSALTSADLNTLEHLLARDFLLIDVMSGSEVTKADFMDVLRTGMLKFEVIDAREQRVRLYETTAVVTGRTQMNGQFNGSALRSTAAIPTSMWNITAAGNWCQRRERRSRQTSLLFQNGNVKTEQLRIFPEGELIRCPLPVVCVASSERDFDFKRIPAVRTLQVQRFWQLQAVCLLVINFDLQFSFIGSRGAVVDGLIAG
jgi:ketosteroid isomerase-like protein